MKIKNILVLSDSSDSINQMFHYNFHFLLLVHLFIFCDDFFFDDFHERPWRFWRFFSTIWRFRAWSIWQLCLEPIECIIEIDSIYLQHIRGFITNIDFLVLKHYAAVILQKLISKIYVHNMLQRIIKSWYNFHLYLFVFNIFK